MGDKRRFFDFDTSNFSRRDLRIYHVLRWMEAHVWWVYAVLGFVVLASLAFVYGELTEDMLWWQAILFLIGAVAYTIVILGWMVILLIASLKVQFGAQVVSQPFRTLASLAKAFQGRKWLLILGVVVIAAPLLWIQTWWSIAIATVVLLIMMSTWMLVP